ncbi:hypothetical protein SEA_OTTAWA_68 [Arthrobacter phage Ottawa]|nr:hypothetical protein SEA_KHARCHO_68 [Arthrobacter phage Kharcho]WIC89300.1 hypothetical protein SEA_OTTAWA_68 [Arthrobacter phage Ottawa]
MGINYGVDRSGRIAYQRIKHVEQRHGFCSACGEPTVRQRTFEGIVHPNNRSRDGGIKSPADVRAEVLRQARMWQANHDHQNCPAIRAERVARRLKGTK